MDIGTRPPATADRSGPRDLLAPQRVAQTRRRSVEDRRANPARGKGPLGCARRQPLAGGAGGPLGGGSRRGRAACCVLKGARHPRPAGGHRTPGPAVAGHGRGRGRTKRGAMAHAARTRSESPPVNRGEAGRCKRRGFRPLYIPPWHRCCRGRPSSFGASLRGARVQRKQVHHQVRDRDLTRTTPLSGAHTCRERHRTRSISYTLRKYGAPDSDLGQTA